MLYFSKLKIVSVIIFTLLLSYFALSNFFSFDDNIYVFGGQYKSKDNIWKHYNDFYRFSVKRQLWAKIQLKEEIPNLYSFTTTVVTKDKLNNSIYISGGFAEQEEFK